MVIYIFSKLLLFNDWFFAKNDKQILYAFIKDLKAYIKPLANSKTLFKKPKQFLL